MSKGKAKHNKSEGGAITQLRSLRLRKRECPSEEISKTEDVPATLCHQDNEEEKNVVLVKPCTVVLMQENQEIKQGCSAKEDPVREEEIAVTFNGMFKVPASQEEDSDTTKKKDSQLEDFGSHTDSVNSKGRDEGEITGEERNRLSLQASREEPQVFLQIAQEENGSCAVFSEEQPNKDSNFVVERNQETSKEEPSKEVVDGKVIQVETTVGLPAKKKRRMGMCGLTEKERSHILQAQKRENGKMESERQAVDINDNVKDQEIISPTCLPSPLSILAGKVLERKKAEMELLSNHCGGNSMPDPEVQTAVKTSNGTSTKCNASYSQEKIWEAGRSIMPDPEETTVPGSSLSAEEHNEKEEISEGNDESAANHTPALTICSYPAQNDETEGQQSDKAFLLQEKRNEKREEWIGDGNGSRGDEDTPSRSVGLNCGSVQPCGAGETPGGSERKDTCDREDNPGASHSTENDVPSETGNVLDPFGSGGLNYVSDSQFNTISLIEEEEMEKDDFGFPDCPEDASDHISGLVRELSSLNRKVMATQRELENLRRSSKSSRSFTR